MRIRSPILVFSALGCVVAIILCFIWFYFYSSSPVVSLIGNAEKRLGFQTYRPSMLPPGLSITKEQITKTYPTGVGPTVVSYNMTASNTNYSLSVRESKVIDQLVPFIECDDTISNLHCALRTTKAGVTYTLSKTYFSNNDGDSADYGVEWIYKGVHFSVSVDAASSAYIRTYDWSTMIDSFLPYNTDSLSIKTIYS